MSERKTIRGERGILTYAHIDGPDDKWFWAIVTEYKGCQDYGDVLFAFEEYWEPEESIVVAILRALEERR